MGDAGRPPAKRAFEPPPWEREQFDELARKRLEQDRERRAEQEQEQEQEEAPSTSEPDGTRSADVAAAAGESGEAEPGMDGKRVDAMLIELSGEEAPALQPVKTASKIVAGLVATVGLAIIVIAVVLGIKAESSGLLAVTSAGIGAIIGAALIGAATWLWLRAKR